MSDPEKNWYVIRAISGQESKVKTYIEKEVKALGIEHLVTRVLIPTEKVFTVRNGKKVSKERNYLPGYILIEAVLTGEVPHIITSLPGVIGFLGSKDKPEPLRQSEVNRILGKADELSEADEELNIPYIVGESVTVIDGPFNSFTGTIEEINENKKKLKVMIKIFERRTLLELSFTQVMKQS